MIGKLWRVVYLKLDEIHEIHHVTDKIKSFVA